MLSRSAGNLHWLSRYIERAECTARLIEMGRRMVMLPGANTFDEWRSVIVASGAPVEIDRDARLTETEAVYLLLVSPENASSIRNCLARARENGRAVRTGLTQEMWEALNEGWRRFENVDASSACRDLPQHLEWVRMRVAHFRGAVETGMLRTDGYDFLRLGAYIERADMMLRLLDVKYYALLPETQVVGGSRDHYQWTSVLHANSARRAYHHVYGGDHSPRNIAEFLILNDDYPRSLAFSYTRIGEHLTRLSRRYGKRHTAHELANDMIARLSDLDMDQIFQYGLHSFITDTIAFNARLSRDIGTAYDFS